MSPTSDQSINQLRTTFLVLRCQAGDEDAFSGLYGLYSKSTLRYLTSVVGTDLAEDVKQEAWVCVFRKISSLDNPKRFKPWLYRIVRNAGIDHLRRLQLEERLFEYPDDSVGGFERHPSLAFEPDLDSDAIQHAIERLSPIHQEVVVLRYWEGFSYAEVAMVTGIPIGSVRSRLHHAKSQLKTLFETEIHPF